MNTKLQTFRKGKLKSICLCTAWKSTSNLNVLVDSINGEDTLSSLQIKMGTPLSATCLQEDLFWHETEVAQINRLGPLVKKFEVIVEHDVSKEQFEFMSREKPAGAKRGRYISKFLSLKGA